MNGISILQFPSDLDMATLETRLDALFSEAIADGEPGLAVGIARHGVVLYRRGFGLANTEWNVPNSAATRMRIGSTTKQFTCLALLLLSEDGLIDPDADIREWLPELPRSTPVITPRLIMQHRSGLRCNLDLWMIGTALRGRLPDEEPVEQMLRLRSLNARPSERVIYSNGGYVLLAHLVERVCRQSFGDFLTQRIFKPLQMHATQLLSREETLLAHCATLHAPDEHGGFRRAQMLMPMSGEGGLVSNVDDLLLWLRHMDAPVIGNANTWAAMRAQTRMPNGALSDYGLGLITRPYRGITLLGHPGAVPGGHTEVFKILEHGLDVVLLANRSDLRLNTLARKVIDIVLGPHLDRAPCPALASTFDRYCGTYYGSDSGELLTIASADGQLLLDFGGVRAPLWQAGDGLRFSGSIEDIDLRIEDHDQDVLTVSRHGQAQRFARLAPHHDPTSIDARSLLGRYRCAEWPGEIEIAMTPSRLGLGLQVRHGRFDYELRPLAPGLWQAIPLDPSLSFRVTVEVDRDPLGACVLRLSTMRTLRLPFQRLDAKTNPLSPAAEVAAPPERSA